MPKQHTHLTDEERFRFDLQGFLVIKNVLSPGECDQLWRLADEIWPETPEDGPFRRTGTISRWHVDFLNLIDHPKVLPYLIELMGSRLRIDHDYCIFMKKGATRNYLHGGPRLFETDHWYQYQDGRMRNGLTVATWVLSDANPGDGGKFLQQSPLDWMREGNTLVVWRLNRLGRSLPQLVATVSELEESGFGFRSLTEGIDTTTASGTLVFHVFGALAQFERDLIRERTMAGLAASTAPIAYDG